MFSSRQEPKVRITKIDRNLPDEKRFEIQTESGEIGYFECRYDPRSETTKSTVYYQGDVFCSVVNPVKGNHVEVSMIAAFNKMPPLDKSITMPT